MLKMDYGDGGYPSKWVRLCDSCRLSASTLYCHTDSAYLCSSCDGQIHGPGSPGWPHHRVKLCGACENAPVAFTCKADDASLCVNCDFEIHSANPIASRHNRVPVSPLSHIPNDNNGATPDDQPNYEVVDNKNNTNSNISSKEMDEREADSWLLLGSADTIDSQVDDGLMFGETEDDHHAYVGLFEECDSSTKFQIFQEDRDQGQQTYSFSEEMNESDSVVPVQSVEDQPKQLQPQQQQNVYFNMEQKPSRVAFTNYALNCRSVAVPCMDAQMLQRGTMSDMAGYRFPKGTEMFPSASVPMQIHFGRMNRRAGVEKYREKKKSRKFEKRIRYAYRKAYAEKRPRVKGRFVKRQDLTSDEAVPLH